MLSALVHWGGVDREAKQPEEIGGLYASASVFRLNSPLPPAETFYGDNTFVTANGK